MKRNKYCKTLAILIIADNLISTQKQLSFGSIRNCAVHLDDVIILILYFIVFIVSIYLC